MSAAPKWTPGPWRIGCDYCGEKSAIVAMAHVHVAAVRPVSTGRPETDDECIANAALIAAAPDMAEALRGVLESFSADGQYNSRTGPFDGILDMLASIRAALAKARGDDETGDTPNRLRCEGCGIPIPSAPEDASADELLCDTCLDKRDSESR